MDWYGLIWFHFSRPFEEKILDDIRALCSLSLRVSSQVFFSEVDCDVETQVHDNHYPNTLRSLSQKAITFESDYLCPVSQGM